jgi:hypothetical protein
MFMHALLVVPGYNYHGDWPVAPFVALLQPDFAKSVLIICASIGQDDCRKGAYINRLLLWTGSKLRENARLRSSPMYALLQWKSPETEDNVGLIIVVLYCLISDHLHRHVPPIDR